VVDPGDVAALAGAIKRLLDNPDEAATLGRRARERCEARYSFRVARATLFPLLEKLTARR
jgi:glycosyltransferase involved in cell wall biosynthesis